MPLAPLLADSGGERAWKTLPLLQYRDWLAPGFTYSSPEDSLGP